MLYIIFWWYLGLERRVSVDWILSFLASNTPQYCLLLTVGTSNKTRSCLSFGRGGATYLQVEAYLILCAQHLANTAAHLLPYHNQLRPPANSFLLR